MHLIPLAGTGQTIVHVIMGLYISETIGRPTERGIPDFCALADESLDISRFLPERVMYVLTKAGSKVSILRRTCFNYESCSHYLT